MKVNYKDAAGILLGSCEYSSFSEILIPSYNGNYDYYLKIKFSNQNSHIWKIISLVFVSSVEVDIVVEPQLAVHNSLATLSRSQGKRPKEIIRDFSVVEVEFGFFEQVFDGQSQNNRFYTDSLLNGEIHKRRPCLVHSFDYNTAQVIPLTSKQKQPSPFDIAVDLSLVKDLSHKYHKPTFALLNLLQPVSYERIFAPFLKSGHSQFTKNQVLSLPDRTSLRDGLSNIYKANVELEQLKTSYEKLNRERLSLIGKVKNKSKDLASTQSYLLELGRMVGDGETLDEIIKSIVDRKG